MYAYACATNTVLSAAVAGFLSAAQPAFADNGALTRLDTDNPEAFAFFDAIGMYDFLRIVSDESVLGADQIRSEFFPDLDPEVWESEMRQLFAVETLVTNFEAAWDATLLDADDRAVVMAFFTSELGERIVAAEIAARAGMADPGIAEAAQSAVLMAEQSDDPRLARHAEFSAQMGLVDRSVASMMNAQLLFLSGLSDGGGLEPPLPEDEILRFVAAQMPALQLEASDWLAAYQLMAYGALEPGDFALFAQFNDTEVGRALATSIFAAFDETFDATQYELGLIAARYVVGDDI